MIADLAKCRGVTERQREVLLFIHNYISQYGQSPTHAEVAVRFGMKNKSIATEHIRALHRRGYLDQTPRSPRSLRLTLLGKDAIGLTTDSQERSLIRCRELLSRAADLLAQTIPSAPILADIRKEIT